MSQPAVSRVDSASDMRDALSVRRSVFIAEQGVPEALEIDEHDGDPAIVTSAVHVLVRLDGAPVGTGRLILRDNDGLSHIGRVAVLAEQRGRGYGRLVMQALHDVAREHGIRRLTLAAQLHAIGFYQRLGYTVHGDVFLDAGIEHRWMDIEL